ncbi:hypothetical protein V6N13_017100 [Hibiscus sabdariffa]|uniref:Uncharacterized protein n=1 Tax=Hibiscus sabdariffa TaxID=183260 RepID=A0ABR2CYC2_9ROSI
MDANLETIAKISAICNDAGVTHSDHKFLAHGMPTEAAIKSLMLIFCSSRENGPSKGGPYDGGAASNDVLRCCLWWKEYKHRIATLEFDRDRKSMDFIVKSKSGRRSLLMKVLLISHL